MVYNKSYGLIRMAWFWPLKNLKNGPKIPSDSLPLKITFYLYVYSIKLLIYTVINYFFLNSESSLESLLFWIFVFKTKAQVYHTLWIIPFITDHVRTKPPLSNAQNCSFYNWWIGIYLVAMIISRLNAEISIEKRRILKKFRNINNCPPFIICKVLAFVP